MLKHFTGYSQFTYSYENTGYFGPFVKVRVVCFPRSSWYSSTQCVYTIMSILSWYLSIQCVYTAGGYGSHCGQRAGQYQIYGELSFTCRNNQDQTVKTMFSAVYMWIGGICAVVATAAIALFCFFSGLHCMMQVQYLLLIEIVSHPSSLNNDLTLIISDWSRWTTRRSASATRRTSSLPSSLPS